MSVDTKRNNYFNYCWYILEDNLLCFVFITCKYDIVTLKLRICAHQIIMFVGTNKLFS